eukprot:scaffold39854_cov53-Attheya_sp.AAC.2
MRLEQPKNHDSRLARDDPPGSIPAKVSHRFAALAVVISSLPLKKPIAIGSLLDDCMLFLFDAAYERQYHYCEYLSFRSKTEGARYNAHTAPW